MKGQKKKQNGITLIALVISIIVMLILAGVSLNMTVGDNGIIKQAQEATMLNSLAMLQDYIDQEYVKNYDEYEYSNEDSKVARFRIIHPEIFYNPAQEGIGALNYLIDSKGHVLYLIKKQNLPDEIKQNIIGGDAGTGTYQDYLNMNDVYGVTADLKVYYSNSTGELSGIDEENLNVDNPLRTVFSEGSGFAKLINSDGSVVTAQKAREVRTLTINADSDITDLSDIYNLTSLEVLKINNKHLSSLKGIENTTKLHTIYLTNCTFDSYDDLGGIKDNLKKLFLVQTKDEELDKLFGTWNETTNTGVKKGMSNYDFSKLYVLEISGVLIDESYADNGGYAHTSYNNGVRNANVTSVKQLNNLSAKTKSNITHLCINNNCITNLNGVNGFNNLYLLRAETNLINDISSLENINLTYCFLCHNQLGSSDTATKTALDPLKNVSGSHSKLYFLRLNSNVLKKVNPLSTFSSSALAYLYCKDNKNITDVSTVKDLSCYKEFDEMYALSLIASSSTILDLRNQTLTFDNLNAIASCTGLEELSLNNVKIKNDSNKIISDSNATAEERALAQTKVKTMLQSLKNLRSLDLYNQIYINDLSFVDSWNIKTAYYFRFDNTQITSLAKLNRFGTALRYVSIKGAPCQINSLSDTSLIPILSIDGRAYSTIFSSEWLCCMGLDSTQASNFTPPAGLTKVVLLGSTVDLDFSSISTIESINIRDSSTTFTFDPTNITSITAWSNTIKFADGKTGGSVWSKTGNNDTTFLNVLKTFSSIRLELYNISMDFNNYSTYCSKITELSQSPQFVRDWSIKGLNLLTNITSMKISINGTMTISDASSLTRLTYVSITNPSQANILNLLPISKLQTLILTNSQVSDISPLEKATNLTTLNLYNSLMYDRISYTSVDGTVYNNEPTLNILLKLNKNALLKNLYIEQCNNLTDTSILLQGSWLDKKGF